MDMILIVDDDSAIRSSLSLMLRRAGKEVLAVPGPAEALAVVRQRAPRLVLMDMNFSLSTSGEEGLHLLRQIKIFQPEVPVILMTAWGSIPLAVEGMQAGAFDFITKPWNNLLLMQRIETALELTAATAGAPSEGDFDRSLIVGESRALTEVLEVLRRISRTHAPVLIAGENGTGKELVAETIHRNSLRAAQPFVKVNLGGISQSLFESEMFGHKKGAFTGAVADRAGRFELAEHGTIFLDEIGELDLACQVKLLRVLQDQTYEVLGDSRQRKADVRVISATNAHLPRMIAEHTFREDLYYRINLITVKLPALRDRIDDIPLLVDHFLERQCRQYDLPPVQLDPDACHFLQSLPYPGNIRELKNLVERTLLVCCKNRLSARDFQAQYVPAAGEAVAASDGMAALQGMTLEEMEHQAIVAALRRCDGNLSQTALTLGISRGALYRRMEKYQIVPEDGKEDS